jgi:hypothetical protein
MIAVLEAIEKGTRSISSKSTRKKSCREHNNDDDDDGGDVMALR